MNLFDVYALFDITPVKGQGCYIWDNQGEKYLDLYGGHAVISIGHSHPDYVSKISNQLSEIGFYSNSVQNPMQQEFATKLGELSGYDDYNLFLCNSGAEANENALKLASFHTDRKKIVAFRSAFHGRTSAAVAITDNPKIVAPINDNVDVVFIEMNDVAALEKELAGNDVAAVIIEGIMGIGGIRIPEPAFLEKTSELCKASGTVLILDEIQSGYGRSGKFFAHQYSNVKPDIITVAKGMGNGFPLGAVLISPEFKPWTGMLGTTFGGSYLACAAGIAVLDVMKNEQLVENSSNIGAYLMKELSKIDAIEEIRGHGLMIGLEFDQPIAPIRKKLLFEKKIFTGVSGTQIIRILPPLCLTKEQADVFIGALKEVLDTE